MSYTSGKLFKLRLQGIETNSKVQLHPPSLSAVQMSRISMDGKVLSTASHHIVPTFLINGFRSGKGID